VELGGELLCAVWRQAVLLTGLGFLDLGGGLQVLDFGCIIRTVRRKSKRFQACFLPVQVLEWEKARTNCHGVAPNTLTYGYLIILLTGSKGPPRIIGYQ